jgi:hypothetical protein
MGIKILAALSNRVEVPGFILPNGNPVHDWGFADLSTRDSLM